MRKLDPLPQPEVAVPDARHRAGGLRPRAARRRHRSPIGPSGGEPLLLAAAHEYLMHQRNAWDHAVEEAQRFFDRVIARGQDAPSLRDVQLGSFLTPSSDLGPDTFEMPEPNHARAAADVTAVDRRRSRRDAGRGRRRRRSAPATVRRDRRARRTPPRPRRSARHHRRLSRNRQHARQARRGAAPRAGAAGRRSGVRRAAGRSARVAERRPKKWRVRRG